ncbi:flowering time control protein FCA isoform X2 [Vicia villosa]|uniref:flowering time control protein FCA isoform X2 n=1 Tax=Vicia villosa TaxID=3911 RepID=UPI00273C6039|nr:flowering time control protein FCA isoform X2 [Vicia villosa]
MNYNRRSPGGFRSVPAPPQRWSPGRVGAFRPPGAGEGFRPVGGEGAGDFGFNNHQQLPMSGQKRGFPFSGRGALPDHFDGGNFAKLFVGSVPRTATEEDIRPLFEEHGNVIEVALIKDRKTGQHQGCCFIKYATSEEADQAIRALHNQYTLPGGLGPIQVRYADGERERLGAVEYKLFVGSLNKQALVEEVEEVFSKYGRVEDVYLMRDDKKQSRGCGFVKYSHRDMALAAINGLNGIYTMRGCDQPLIVRFADPKRPRQGDSRGPALGAAGFGPRLDAPGTRFPSNNSDPMGDRMPPPNAWRPTRPPNTGTSFNAGFHGMGPPLMPRSGDMTLPLSASGPMTGIGASIDVRFQAPSPSAMPQQNFNQPRPQIPPVNQPMPPPQKPIQSSQEFPPSHQLYPQAPRPYPQTSTLPSLRQHGQPQPLSAGPQGLGINAQFSVPQPQAQQSVLSATFPQTSLDTSVQSNSALTTPSRQQIPPSMQQQQQPLQPLQSLQQSPSQLAQLASQQTQTLQASFHSSQQAFSQLQQQLQMIQPSSQALTLQHHSEATKTQSQWGGPVSHAATGTHVAAPAAAAPSSTAATSSVQALSQNTTVAKCNWTEHLSPEGFKYYYNSVTGESRWEKPEELTLFEQQKQQHSQSVQQSQIRSQSSIPPTQQIVQNQQVQPQSHFREQALHHQQIQQPSSAFGVTGHQNVQEPGYKQLQTSFVSAGAPGRYSQGINTTQEVMWKNRPAGV